MAGYEMKPPTDPNDAHEAMVSYSRKGGFYMARDDTKLASECFEKALTIARKIGDRPEEFNTLCNLGEAYSILRKHRDAIKVLEQALVIAREIGKRRGERTVLRKLGEAYSELGDSHHSIEFSMQHLALARKVNDLADVCKALSKLIDEHRKLGNMELCEKFLHEYTNIMFYNSSTFIDLSSKLANDEDE